MGIILLENMAFYAYHGVLPEERIIGAKYEVSVRLDFNFREAAHTDNLEQTINYAKIYDLVKEEMSVPSHLIEHAGQRILDKIKEQYPQIKWLEVKLSKYHPPVAGELTKATVILTYPDRNPGSAI
jgi:dihydroneopterin aldolase